MSASATHLRSVNLDMISLNYYHNDTVDNDNVACRLRRYEYAGERQLMCFA